MTTSTERQIHQTTRPAGRTTLPQQRLAGTAEVRQRFARDYPQPVAKGRGSRIRAWRADETDPSRTTKPGSRAAVQPAASTVREPFGRDAGVGARRSAHERAARMHAIEQAWRRELARQAQLEAGAR